MIRLRSTTEFKASAPPFGVVDILQDLIHLIFERDYPDWVGVRLPKDSTYSSDVMGGFQVNILAENPDVTFDPVPTEGLYLFDIRIRDARFVREIKT